VAAAVAMAPTEMAGFKPASNWNSARMAIGTLAALTLSNGTATAASATWNAPAPNNPGTWLVGYADAPGDVRMMNGYLDPTSPSMPATVTVSGLPATITTGGYDLYVYMNGDPSATEMRNYQYTIGATTMTVNQTGVSLTFSGYVLAPAGGMGNYIVFRGVTGASFTLTATPGTSTPANRQRAPVNGIQIVSPTGS
jgi:hypothetical protein